jgi:hypothetical protein
VAFIDFVLEAGLLNDKIFLYSCQEYHVMDSFI